MTSMYWGSTWPATDMLQKVTLPRRFQSRIPSMLMNLFDASERYDVKLLCPTPEPVCTLAWKVPRNMDYRYTSVCAKTSASLTKSASSISDYALHSNAVTMLPMPVVLISSY